jgi:hypothetical protein
VMRPRGWVESPERLSGLVGCGCEDEMEITHKLPSSWYGVLIVTSTSALT